MNSFVSLLSIFDYPTAAVICEFIFVFLALTAVNVFIDLFIKRLPINITLGVLSGAFIIFYTFQFLIFSIVILAAIIILVIISIFVNLAEFRFIFANKTTQKRNDKVLLNKNLGEIDKIYNKEELYKTVNETVMYLSKRKIGAIMTFEKKDNLKAIIKNGSILNAPVTFELLITIFYPGTRLHDGAVVIKDNIITAASVYYTPTTKPLTGKYGSRHRAAIGISEICDAVTVVVSEETGRISIAYNGELETYAPDRFYKAFTNIMSESDVLSADDSTGGHSVNGF